MQPGTFQVYVQPAGTSNFQRSAREQRKQALAAMALVCLGLCAAVLIVQSQSASNGSDDSILNFVHSQRVELGLFGEGQEKDLAHMINTAFETFKKSKNETVKSQIAQFDPKAEEDKVKDYEDEIKQVFDEVGLEGKSLAKWAKPEK